MARPLLSKSKYLVGLQCPRLLWHHYNAKDRLPPVDEQTQALFDQGHEVGLLAQRLFPGGIGLEWDASYEEVLRRSLALLRARKPLFEAGFRQENGYARVDILEPAPGGKWDLIEVKSGTSVKDPNWDDVAFQKSCCEAAGAPIRKCHLMHVDNTYVRQGEIDPSGFFVREDITQAVAEKSVGLEHRLREMLGVIALRKCPESAIGPHCDAPYSCPLRPECWEQVDAHENNVFTLHRLGAKAWDLYRAGVVENERIPPDFRLSRSQQVQLEAERTGKPQVNRPAVAEFLAHLELPLHFLDFETFQTAIPMIDGTRPWQQIPFQFSLHVAGSVDARPVPHSWLWDGIGDPRKELLDRVVDLLSPFSSFDAYCPSQHGSASIKQVLPALTGKSYGDLAIQDGGQASEAFKRVTFAQAEEKERREVRRSLEEYCGLDTKGMLDIITALRKLV